MSKRRARTFHELAFEMIPASIGFIFTVLIVALEVYSGAAVIGMRETLKRRTSPGPFWFVVALHGFSGTLLSVYVYILDVARS